MSRRRSPSVATEPAPTGPSHWPATVLLAALLAIMAARTMLNEPTFHRSPIAATGAYTALAVPQQIYTPLKVVRVVTASVILSLTALWAFAAAIRPGRRRLRHPIFAAGLALMAGCLLVSALLAPDRREGLITAIEQISLLAAGFLAMQCAAAAWQRRLALVVLAALAAMLGVRGVYQAYVEIPEQVADFEQNRAERLTGLGHPADSPEAAMLETRLREQTPKGFWSLANVFASLMVLVTFAAAGLAVDKWIDAKAAADTRGQRGPPARRGEIPLPMVAAGVSTLVIVPAVVTWWLTESTGAIGSGVVAAIAATVLYLIRHWAGRHRRALVVIAVIGLVAAMVGVVGLGLARGGLPIRTLQVRWEYWTGSTKMLAEGPMWGVGPGNFPDAYLPHRQLGAEEAVKNPHNVIVQAVTEYGLAAGAAYLALLGWILLKLTAADRKDIEASPEPTSRSAWIVAACIGVGAAVWRLASTTYPNALVAAIDTFMPIATLMLGIAAAMWVCRDGRTALSTRWRFAGIATACGLGGFALHNLSDFALFKSGAAMVFWVSAGAIVAGKRGREWKLPKAAAWAIAVVVSAGVAATATYVLGPVVRAERHVYAAATAYSAHRGDAALAHLAQAVEADPADGATASDMAGLLLRKAQGTRGPQLGKTLADAARYAKVARERQPQRAVHRMLALELAILRLDDELFRFAWADPPADVAAKRAQVDEYLTRSPDNPELLNAAAQLAYAAGDYDQAQTHLDLAIKITAGRSPILYDRLGDVLYARGQADQAARMWRRYRTHTSTLAVRAAALRDRFDRLAAMDPYEPYRRLRMAGLAYRLGLTDIARRELAAAEVAEAALWPGSVMKFNARRGAEIDLLTTKLAAAGEAVRADHD